MKGFGIDLVFKHLKNSGQSWDNPRGTKKWKFYVKPDEVALVIHVFSRSPPDGNMAVSWLRCFMRATILYGSLTYQEANGIKTQSRDCLHVDPAGNKYNLTSLRNTDETAR